MSRRPSKPI